MHAVVVSVTINDFEEAMPDLRERVVPQVKQAPGFAAGYWVALDGHQRGRAVIAFESEDAARQAAGMIEQAADTGVTVESVDIGEVVAQA
jgi:hypothetical protein